MSPSGGIASSFSLNGTAVEPFVSTMRPELAPDPAPGSIQERHLRIGLERCPAVQIVVLVHAKLHLPADRRAFDEARRGLSHKSLVVLAARTLVNIVPRKSATSGTFSSQR